MAEIRWLQDASTAIDYSAKGPQELLVLHRSQAMSSQLGIADFHSCQAMNESFPGIESEPARCSVGARGCWPDEVTSSLPCKGEFSFSRKLPELTETTSFLFFGPAASSWWPFREAGKFGGLFQKPGTN